ncbi:hypothetical protein, partial [Streptomyces sp. NPDC048845]|uniref:hypothetical protein n=1 Tax=Streptomyces sp. NPDC048845 TaxID=3155390 RepID=UPI003417C685
GVDFWHAVEFSKNGRFLRTRLRALRALPFGVPNLTRRFPFRFRSELLPVARWKAFAFRLIPTLTDAFRSNRIGHCIADFPDGPVGISCRRELWMILTYAA